MASRLAVAIFVAFIGVGAYFATLPVPEGLPHPWILRSMAMVNFLVGSGNLVSYESNKTREPFNMMMEAYLQCNSRPMSLCRPL